MKQISKTEFYQLLSMYPNGIANTVTMVEPSLTYFWKDKAQPGEDRSFGKNAYLCIRNNYDLNTGEEMPEYYICDHKE